MCRETGEMVSVFWLKARSETEARKVAVVRLAGGKGYIPETAAVRLEDQGRGAS